MFHLLLLLRPSTHYVRAQLGKLRAINIEQAVQAIASLVDGILITAQLRANMLNQTVIGCGEYEAAPLFETVVKQIVASAQRELCYWRAANPRNNRTAIDFLRTIQFIPLRYQCIPSRFTDD